MDRPSALAEDEKIAKKHDKLGKNFLIRLVLFQPDQGDQNRVHGPIH